MSAGRVTVDGVELRRGSLVRLRPRPGADVWDIALAGRVALVDSIEQDMEDAMHLAVVVADDPGRDLAHARQMGHRFFFRPDEVEPLPDPRVLVAGIGNVFIADDGWGVALAGRLAERELPPGVQVTDFGIRGMDLAYALGEGWDAVVLLDATPRGQAPGTLYVIEADTAAEAEGVPDAHGMNPLQVLALARNLGAPLPPVYVVGCEPRTRMTGEEEEIVSELSEPVIAALDEAVRLVEALLDDIRTNQPEGSHAP